MDSNTKADIIKDSSIHSRKKNSRKTSDSPLHRSDSNESINNNNKHPSECSSSLAYKFIEFIASLILNIFFRQVGSRGSHRVPSKGAVLMVAAPHANQFLDPLVLLHKSNARHIHFLIAAKSMTRIIVGWFARKLEAIPVERPQDVAIKGIGKIRLKSDLVLVGVDTRYMIIEFIVCRFVEQTSKHAGKIKEKITGWQIALKKDAGTLLIDKIVGETEISLKKAIDDKVMVEQLQNLCEFSLVPMVDQTTVYEKVYDSLGRGETVGIFPEGGSHDRAEMLPLKAGASLMALGALCNNNIGFIIVRQIP